MHLFPAVSGFISIHALREEGDDKIVAEPFDEW